MSFLFKEENSYQITEKFRLGRQGYLYIPFKKAVHIEEDNSKKYNVNGRIWDTDTIRETIVYPHYTQQGVLIVTHWNIIQIHNMKKYNDRRTSPDERKKLIIKVPFEWIDIDKIEIIMPSSS